MNVSCRRAEELFSDHLEGSLAPPLEGELVAHLDTCSECASLYVAFQEILSVLEASKVPAPPEGLMPRLTAAVPSRQIGPSSASGDRRERPRRVTSPRALATSSWLAVAAVIALLLLWRPPELGSELWRKTSMTAHQTYSFGVRTFHQTERWIEDLNVLRITVGVAFEDSLERINEQLRDLELTGRESNDDSEESRELRPRSSFTHRRAGLIASEDYSRSPL